MLKKTTKKLQIKASKPMLKELSVTKFIPNMTTVTALCIGLSAIRFAILNRFSEAVISIIVAAILDGIDGRIARLLKASSDFGAELDSLSDFINFGVAPAIVIYLISLHDLHAVGWGIIVCFAVCMSLRLARFNTTSIKQQEAVSNEQLLNQGTNYTWKNKFFIGVPAPAGAFLVIWPIIIKLAYNISWIINPYLYSVFVLFVGLLVVSKLPTYSFKSLTIPRNKVAPYLILGASLVALVIHITWITISSIIALYLFSIPFSMYDYKKLQVQKNNLRGIK